MDDKKKKMTQTPVEKDTFWMKVLIVTIVIVWISLVAGSWAGHYFADTKILSRKSLNVAENTAAEKPRTWKTIVDNDGQEKDRKKDDGVPSEVTIPDFRNIDDPIPGIDDQSIRTLGASPREYNPVQEPSAAPAGTVEKTETPGSTTVRPSPEPTKEKPEESPEPPRSTLSNPDKETKPREKPSQSSTPAAMPSATVKATVKTPMPAASASPSVAPSRNPREEAASDKKKKDESKPANYDLQMGSFSRSDNADKMVDELKKKGYSAKIEKVKDGDREFYKVKLDNVGSPGKAQEQAGKLKQDGFDAIIISR
ncbi:MAG: SPOR domain-containing protein [Candidatus Eremiobacteraeota bacterium]|nr:SPOR domain-containing protein [Candidatus Eremiobacteraeota bacterium]